MSRYPHEELTAEMLLRKQCLEWAFETRRLNEVWHMEVTNVAQDYYRWITAGESQGSQIAQAIRTTPESEGE